MQSTPKILRAFRQAFEACLDIRILLLLFVPFVLAAVISFVIFFTLGTLWIGNMSGLIQESAVVGYLTEKWSLISASTAASISYFFTLVIFILILLPVSYLLAVILVSIVLMPIILKILEKKSFPTLEKKHGGSFVGGVWNTITSSAIYLALLLVTLPLWLIPGLQIVVPVLLSSYLNKRVFTYDVLEEYASKEERMHIEKENRGALYGTGIILGLFNYFPLAFVLLPVFVALVYSYYCLNELVTLRENKSIV